MKQAFSGVFSRFLGVKLHCLCVLSVIFELLQIMQQLNCLGILGGCSYKRRELNSRKIKKI